MKKNKVNKTNVCRILDIKNINYDFFLKHENQEFENINESRKFVFKTLVLEGSDKNHYVCVIPVDEHLDLKKSAKSFKIKSIEMTLQRDLKKHTGYIHGGCSPIGMKNSFNTLIDISAKSMEYIIVSAGKVGHFIKISPKDLSMICGASFCDLVVE